MKRRLRLSLSACVLVLAAGGLARAAFSSAEIRKETVGVWLSPGQFGTDKARAAAAMASTLADYRRAGIDTLFVLVKTTSGHVYYSSRLAPMDPAWNWDFTAEFLSQAAKQDMTVQAWFCVFPEGSLAGRVREHPECPPLSHPSTSFGFRPGPCDAGTDFLFLNSGRSGRSHGR